MTKLYVLIKTLIKKISEENLKSKPKQFRLEKGIFFGVNLIRQLCPKHYFTKIISSYNLRTGP